MQLVLFSNYNLYFMYTQYCVVLVDGCNLCILIVSLCIHNVVYVFLDAATLSEVFPCFLLSCKANARV